MARIKVTIPNPEGCYSLCILNDLGERVACSGKIRISSNKCNTLLFRWRNNENAFGYAYSGNTYMHQMRLPAVLAQPDTEDNTTVFVDSAGEAIVLQSRLVRIYELRIGNLDQDQHHAIAVMLAHDVVEVFDENTGAWQRIVKTGKYDVKYTSLRVGSAKCKVRLTPFDEINSYCNP